MTDTQLLNEVLGALAGIKADVAYSLATTDLRDPVDVAEVRSTLRQVQGRIDKLNGVIDAHLREEQPDDMRECSVCDGGCRRG